jgi:hypothetical protein
MLTVSQVKRDLPWVAIKIGGRVLTARVSGRLNPFATVTVAYIDNGKPNEYLRGAPWADYQFSWEAVTRAINNATPLTV